MPYTVRSTRVADRQIAGLRGPRRKAYVEFEQALARQGCAALSYRLTGDDPLPSLCVKHLRGNDRVVVAFSGDEAWVLLVGPHTDGDAAADVYGMLYELAGAPARHSPERSRRAATRTGSHPSSTRRQLATSSGEFVHHAGSDEARDHLSMGLSMNSRRTLPFRWPTVPLLPAQSQVVYPSRVKSATVNPSA